MGILQIYRRAGAGSKRLGVTILLDSPIYQIKIQADTLPKNNFTKVRNALLAYPYAAVHQRARWKVARRNRGNQ
jgi:hypothetical protein